MKSPFMATDGHLSEAAVELAHEICGLAVREGLSFVKAATFENAVQGLLKAFAPTDDGETVP